MQEYPINIFFYVIFLQHTLIKECQTWRINSIILEIIYFLNLNQ